MIGPWVGLGPQPDPLGSSPGIFGILVLPEEQRGGALLSLESLDQPRTCFLRLQLEEGRGSPQRPSERGQHAGICSPSRVPTSRSLEARSPQPSQEHKPSEATSRLTAERSQASPQTAHSATAQATAHLPAPHQPSKEVLGFPHFTDREATVASHTHILQWLLPDTRVSQRHTLQDQSRVSCPGPAVSPSPVCPQPRTFPGTTK